MPLDRLVVLESSSELAFSFEEMLRYHGGGSPGGVAHAFKVLELALPLLSPRGPVERREILLDTAFGGPGARDGFELVTRAVSDGRFTLDPGLARGELGLARERFVFHLRYRTRDVLLIVREGFVTHEFITLARREARTSDEELRLTAMKAEMAERVMAADARDVYEATQLR